MKTGVLGILLMTLSMLGCGELPSDGESLVVGKDNAVTISNTGNAAASPLPDESSVVCGARNCVAMCATCFYPACLRQGRSLAECEELLDACNESCTCRGCAQVTDVRHKSGVISSVGDATSAAHRSEGESISSVCVNDCYDNECPITNCGLECEGLMGSVKASCLKRCAKENQKCWAYCDAKCSP